MQRKEERKKRGNRKAPACGPLVEEKTTSNWSSKEGEKSVGRIRRLFVKRNSARRDRFEKTFRLGNKKWAEGSSGEGRRASFPGSLVKRRNSPFANRS